MSSHTRRLRASAVLIAVLAAVLILAAAASAETRTGESSTVVRENFPAGEVTLVKADASFESVEGSATISFTTATAPDPESEARVVAALTTSPNCTGKTGRAIEEQLLLNPPPLLAFEDAFSSPAALAFAGSFSAALEVPAVKSVNGTTTTLSLSTGIVANAGFNCAIVAATEGGGEEENDGEELPGEEEVPAGATAMIFPISAPPPPAAPPAAAPAAPSAPPASPAPPALKMAKLKPISLHVGKWQLVKVKVTNTGATGTGLGSLRVKTAKGVLVKPERQQLPVLAPGASWTMTVRVRLTAKAKPKSTLKLTAAASGVTATGPLVLKAKG
jgi:hypothetical protein